MATVTLLRETNRKIADIKAQRIEKRRIVYSSPLEFAISERSLDYSASYAYLRKIQQEISPFVICCKGAQLGFTEAMINICLWRMSRKEDILYLLPSADEVTDFSAARFNPVIEDLKTLKGFNVDNVRHKMLGKTSLYLRGAHSRSKLKNVPVAVLILDERDEMLEKMIALARERLSGHLAKQEFDLSTPSLPDVGIYKDFKACDQYYYFIPCTKCSTKQRLTLEDNLKEAGLCCSKCGAVWTHEEKCKANSKGEYQLLQKGNGVPGYHVSQLYSPTVTPAEILTKLRESENDEIKKQEFYNSKLGLPYEAKGSRLSGELIDSRVGTLPGNRFRVAGIDVSQASLHYVVIASLVEAGLVVEDLVMLSWDNLAKELGQRGVQGVVIDANPERFKAREFVENFGQAWMAFYPNIEEENRLITEKRKVCLNRTMAIDSVFARFANNQILVQANLPFFQVFKEHLKAEVRAYREKRGGGYEAYYTETGPDHYLHALVYAQTAAQFCTGAEQVIGKFI